MKPPVLVTGGTGLIGSVLARALVSRGHVVHVFARSTSDRSTLAGVPVTWHLGQLEDPATLERAVAGVCAGGERPWVVHAAALISYRARDAERLRRVNVDGTRDMLAACRRHPIGRFLHVSSVVAVGHTRADEVGDEDHGFNGASLRCGYVDTKRAAEVLALQSAGELDVVVVSPGAVFGPNARKGNSLRFLRRIARGRLGPFAPPGSLSVVGVEDVADGSILALERGLCGRRYLLVESVHSGVELCARAAEALGARGPRWSAPSALWRALALGAASIDRWRDLDLLTPESLRMLEAHFRFRADRARSELGWRPRSFPEVLRLTVAGLKAQGRLG